MFNPSNQDNYSNADLWVTSGPGNVLSVTYWDKACMYNLLQDLPFTFSSRYDHPSLPQVGCFH